MIKLLEVLTPHSLSFFSNENFFFMFNYLINFCNNVKFFLMSNSFNKANANTLLNDNSSNLNINQLTNFTNENLKNMTTIYNNDFKSNINYNSYFVYLYIIFDLFSTLPSNIYLTLTHLFNLKNHLSTITTNYTYFTNSYLPTLLNDNIFYTIFKNLDSFAFSTITSKQTN